MGPSGPAHPERLEVHLVGPKLGPNDRFAMDVLACQVDGVRGDCVAAARTMLVPTGPHVVGVEASLLPSRAEMRETDTRPASWSPRRGAATGTPSIWRSHGVRMAPATGGRTKLEWPTCLAGR